jgi:hypothetical protein
MQHFTVPLVLISRSGFATERQGFPILHSLQATSGAYIAHYQVAVSMDVSDQYMKLTTYLCLMSRIQTNTSNPPYKFRGAAEVSTDLP